MNKYPDDELYQYILDVTQDDINNGEPGNHLTCPIALAFTRQHNEKNKGLSADEWVNTKKLEPHVWTESTTLVNNKRKRDYYNHSKGVKEWIKTNDSESSEPNRPIKIIVDPVFSRLKLIEEGSDVERRWHGDDQRIS